MSDLNKEVEEEIGNDLEVVEVQGGGDKPPKEVNLMGGGDKPPKEKDPK